MNPNVIEKSGLGTRHMLCHKNVSTHLHNRSKLWRVRSVSRLTPTGDNPKIPRTWSVPDGWWRSLEFRSKVYEMLHADLLELLVMDVRFKIVIGSRLTSVLLDLNQNWVRFGWCDAGGILLWPWLGRAMSCWIEWFWWRIKYGIMWGPRTGTM